MSSVQARKDEILAKKARLAELKKSRELREQKGFASISSSASNRQSLSSDTIEPSHVATSHASPLRASKSARLDDDDLDSFVSSLVGPSTPKGKQSSLLAAQAAAGATQGDEREGSATQDGRRGYADAGTDTQSLTFADLGTVYEIPVETAREYVSYSKGVQTSRSSSPGASELDVEGVDGVLGRQRSKRKGLSQRERELEQEEIRARLRVEIEEELKALSLHPTTEDEGEREAERQRFPSRPLKPEELNAVTSSDDFLHFVERSSKVIERALDEEYDVLADYALHSRTAQDDADAEEDDFTGHKKGRRIKEIASFPLQPTMGQSRMVSAIDFSPKFPELVATAYTKSQTSPHTAPGLLNVWNIHLKSRPEYSLTATSDLLSCLWHPFHPNLLLGGTYSGQLCLWDTRARSRAPHGGGGGGEPVQKTPLSGGRTGHAHPIYSLAVVGTQNASSVISVSTDGVVCSWDPAMLALPNEYLELHAPSHVAGTYKTDDVAPTSICFPASDPTYFLTGTEQGSILPVHRYDRAGAKAGVDARTQYAGHEAPVMGVDFHPSRGKMDLGDLFVSAGLDWSVKVWRANATSGVGGAGGGGLGTAEAVRPLLEVQREDAVYDVRWSPTRPSIFGCVDGGGKLDVYDLLVSSEIPVGSARPSQHERDGLAGGGLGRGAGGGGMRSLNKLAWEKQAGRHVAVGGLDGVTTVFEVGSELGGPETRADAWSGVKKWAARMGRGRLDG